MKLKKICTLSLVISMYIIFLNLSILSAVTLQELQNEKSALSLRLSEVNRKRLNILGVLNSIVSLLSNQYKRKTLSDTEILNLRQEYDRIYFNEFEDVADEWGYLLYRIDFIERKIAKGEYE